MLPPTATRGAGECGHSRSMPISTAKVASATASVSSEVWGRFCTRVITLVQNLPSVLVLALATFAVLIGMERLWPHSPAPLVAVGGGIAASWLLGLQAQGVGIVGLIPQGLPSLTLPDLGLDRCSWRPARSASP